MHDRKSWIEHRLEELAEIFSVAVAGFAILDNHLHLLVRLDPDVAQGWSDEDVVRRWGRLFPPRDKARQMVPVSEEWVQARLKDARWVATARERLQSLSWFMKCLKEPLSRLANREEQTRGAFFEGRFKSVAILDAGPWGPGPRGALCGACWARVDLGGSHRGLPAERDRPQRDPKRWVQAVSEPLKGAHPLRSDKHLSTRTTTFRSRNA